MKEFKFPDVGEGIHDGTIVKWHVKDGDSVKADQVMVEVETDKAIVELPSPVTGKIYRINFHEGTMVKVGETLVTIEEAGGQAAPAAQPTKPETQQPGAPKLAAPAASAAAAPAEGRILAAPSTRKLARELGVDITKVSGSGPGGRITDDDVRKVVLAKIAPSQLPPSLHPEGVNVLPLTQSESETRIPLTGLRKAIADRMTYSKTHIPHACGMDFFDVTRLVQLREKEKTIFQPRGIHITYLPFVVKACVVALKKYPSFNAHFDGQTYELVAKRDINIGIAVDTPEGLIVPVIKNADRKSIVEIAVEIEHLADMSRQRKLRLEEIRDGTFTITNVGSVGGFLSTPIINPPEIGILGVHRIRDMPMVVDGRVEVRKAMGISLCFDHRVVDGAIATEFMNVVKQHLEDPDLLLVDIA